MFRWKWNYCEMCNVRFELGQCMCAVNLLIKPPVFKLTHHMMSCVHSTIRCVAFTTTLSHETLNTSHKTWKTNGSRAHRCGCKITKTNENSTEKQMGKDGTFLFSCRVLISVGVSVFQLRSEKENPTTPTETNQLILQNRMTYLCEAICYTIN